MVDQKTAYRKAQKGATDALTGGLDKATGSYADALTEFAPYTGAGASASTMYADALGLNGPEAMARARETFTAAPGYDYALNEGLTALERRAASQGRLAGGQTGLDTISFAHNLADQGYGDWLDRLFEQQGVGIDVAGKRAGIKTGIGDKQYGYGQDVANVNWNTETGIGQAKAAYQTGKDQSGANIFGAITGGLSMGAKLLGLG